MGKIKGFLFAVRHREILMKAIWVKSNHTQPARRHGRWRGVCGSGKRRSIHIVSRCHFRVIGHCHSEHTRRRHHLHAHAGSRQQPMEIVRVRLAERSGGTNRSHAVLLLASLIMPALPYMLAFAAGAMFYVVVEELIPEASSGQHSNLSTIGFAIGFVLILDVVMG